MRISASGNRTAPPRAVAAGFTLVELLVVIAIIGLLVALLLPAVQSARDAARRIQCVNNLKQLGLAVFNYEGAAGAFPYGSYHTSNNAANLRTQFANWGILILPYIEEQALFDQYNMDLYNSHPDNRPVLRTPLSIQTCPADGQVAPLLVPTQVVTVAPEGIVTIAGREIAAALE